MAKSGFVPAWMKIQSSDKTNGNNVQTQTINKSETSSTSSSPSIITGRQRHHSSDIFDHTTNRHSFIYYSKKIGQNRTKITEQQSLNEFDGQSDGFFSFSSSNGLFRRSYSREHLPNSFSKDSDINGNDSFNGLRLINNTQRRLHSVSSYGNDRQSTHVRHNSANENHADRTLNYLNGDREQTYGNNDSIGFDRLEKDFPSLNGREKNQSTSNEQSSSIWNNAASKFRTSQNDTFKFIDRSLRTNRILPRKDRLGSASSNLNGTSSTSPSTSIRPITLELQTNCRTQTKNLDKRSDFFNSLKNDLINGTNKTLDKQQFDEIKKSSKISDNNNKTSKTTLLLLSVPETTEEKEFLIRMGWKECDELTYEITDKDKEEYEKKLRLLPKSENTWATLMSALYRRTLPWIDIREFLRFEMTNSTSDDDSSEE